MPISRRRPSLSRRWRAWVSSRPRGAAAPGRGPGHSRMRSLRFALVRLALGIACLGASPAWSAPLDDAVQLIEATYRRITDLKAPFKQTAVNRALGQSVDATGTLYLKKPGKLRWEYVTPTPQEVVSDGTCLWVYTSELRQVNVSDAPAALAG